MPRIIHRPYWRPNETSIEKSWFVRQHWNDALAAMASTWASQCFFEHGQPPTDSPLPWRSIGQNLYMVPGAPSLNFTTAIQVWYDEKDDYDHATQRCARGKVCGHYTQVIRSCLVSRTALKYIN